MLLVPLYHSVPPDAHGVPPVPLVHTDALLSLTLDLMIVHYSHTMYVTLVPRGHRLPLTMHRHTTFCAMHV